jgi:hypothetical protein
MRKRSLAGLGLALTLLLGGLATAPVAQSAPVWAPAASAAVHPGVMMFTDGAQCTANFVYTEGTTVYLGYAAHCAGTGAATETDGCLAASLPLGTPVEIDGATRPGTLAYSSWLTMQAGGETNADACAYNDLALVRLDPADVARTNPSIPHWGGPTGINTAGNPMLASVYSYGNSSLRQGIALLSPKTGVSLGTDPSGWTHPVYTVTPGIPGDSGSAMLDAAGRASGVLSTVALAPLAASNNFSDLNLALQYMRSHGGPQASLALGTEPFDGGRLPLGI